MKIALITTCLEVGGAERIVTGMADSLVDLDHEVLIVYLTGEAIILPQSPKVQVVGLGMKSARSFLTAYFKLRKILRAFKPDVVHSHLFHSNILARLLRMTMTVPRLITSVHNTVEGGRLRMLAYRLTDRLTDISTNVSHEAVASFVEKKAVRAGRMLALHNGISTEAFRFCSKARQELRQALGVNDGCKLLICVGKLSEQKDYPNLFKALQTPEMLEIRHRYRVFIVGDGPLEAELKTQVDAAGLEKVVRFLGVRHDVPGLMSAADVFVLPSAWEGFGLVVAEAMACQRVVVATDCGGVREVVGEAGFLIPPRRAVALSTAILEAMDLPDNESAKLGRKARARVVALYSHDVAVEKWLALYKSPILCDSKG